MRHGRRGRGSGGRNERHEGGEGSGGKGEEDNPLSGGMVTVRSSVGLNGILTGKLILHVIKRFYLAGEGDTTYGGGTLHTGGGGREGGGDGGGGGF